MDWTLLGIIFFLRSIQSSDWPAPPRTKKDMVDATPKPYDMGSSHRSSQSTRTTKMATLTTQANSFSTAKVCPWAHTSAQPTQRFSANTCSGTTEHAVRARTHTHTRLPTPPHAALAICPPLASHPEYTLTPNPNPAPNFHIPR